MATFSQTTFPATRYSVFRPTYHPTRLPALLLGYHRGETRRLLDVATGTGQLASTLAPHFDSVDATDPSPAMISSATPYPNITYKLGNAETLDAPDATYDMVTVGQGAHWFERDTFFKEAWRVLRPGGSLCMLGYTYHTLSNPESDKVLFDLVNEKLGAFWEPGRMVLEGLYAGWDDALAQKGFKDVTRTSWKGREGVIGLWDDHGDARRVSLNGIKGYLETWSAYKRWLDAGGDTTVISDAVSKMGQLEGIQDWDAVQVPIQWPHFALFARKPE